MSIDDDKRAEKKKEMQEMRGGPGSLRLAIGWVIHALYERNKHKKAREEDSDK